MSATIEKFTPVTQVPNGFIRVSAEESERLILANHPKHKRWHLVRFDLNGFDHCNVFVEETGELILITVPEGQFANPILFSKTSPIGTKLPTAVHALGVYTAADGVTALPKPGVRNSLETSVVMTERTPSEALKPKLEEKKNNTAVRDGLNRPWPS